MSKNPFPIRSVLCWLFQWNKSSFANPFHKRFHNAKTRSLWLVFIILFLYFISIFQLILFAKLISVRNLGIRIYFNKNLANEKINSFEIDFNYSFPKSIARLLRLSKLKTRNISMESINTEFKIVLSERKK